MIRTSDGWNLVIFSQIKLRLLNLILALASSCAVRYRVATDFIIAHVTVVVDTSTNLV